MIKISKQQFWDAETEGALTLISPDTVRKVNSKTGEVSEFKVVSDERGTEVQLIKIETFDDIKED